MKYLSRFAAIAGLCLVAACAAHQTPPDNGIIQETNNDASIIKKGTAFKHDAARHQSGVKH